MLLHIDSDATYLSEPWKISHTGGKYHLSFKPAKPKKDPHLIPPENGPIHKQCIILIHVVASAVEA